MIHFSFKYGAHYLSPLGSLPFPNLIVGTKDLEDLIF